MANKSCQSCGMPLSRDEQGGGTEADETRSLLYCSRCYQRGAFTKPDMTMNEMIVLVEGKMKEMHIPGFLTPLFTRKIPKLKRWSG